MTASDDRARDEQPVPAEFVDLDAVYATGTAASDALAAESRALFERQPDDQPAPAGDDAKLCFMPIADAPSDQAGLVARCRLPIRHTGRCEPLVQPAPAGDDELREAAEHLREVLGMCKRTPGGHPQSLTDHATEVAVSALAEQGRELERLREENAKLRTGIDHYVGALGVEHEELERLRAELAQLRGWYEQVRAENERLHRDRDRRNDERLAVEAVVQAWTVYKINGRVPWRMTAAALDELVRVQDGGQDR